MKQQQSPLALFGLLKWIDGRPLIDTIEPYRRDLFMKALYEFRDDGTPLINQVLSGRAKKNFKSTDLVLAALYRLVAWWPAGGQGNDCFIIANDEDQAGDDLDLARKLVIANPDTLGAELLPYAKEIRRKDGTGSLQVLPARDSVGVHGKSYLFLGFDEIHGYRDWRLMEALQPDLTRPRAIRLWRPSIEVTVAAKVRIVAASNVDS